jgi:ankyrin repeat protein
MVLKRWGTASTTVLPEAEESRARQLLDSPPDGVDFGALDPSAHSLPSPQECRAHYEQAFQDAGGDQAMREMEVLARHCSWWWWDSNDLQARDSLGWGRCWKPKQMGALQSYDLEYMMHNLGRVEVREQGERLLRQLGQDIQEKVGKNVYLEVAEVKKEQRARLKVQIKYAGVSSELCDLNRATLVCPDIRIMYRVSEYLFKRFGPSVCLQGARLLEWEDHYQHPMTGGYRHLQAIMSIGASLWEVQINTAPMNQVKHRVGHKLYKTTRFIQEMMLLCAMEGDAGALQEMLETPGASAIANPNFVRDKNGLSALHHSALRGDSDMLQMLLSEDWVEVAANTWSMDGADHGGLPLTYALAMCHYEVAQVLVDTMAVQAPRKKGVGRKAKERFAEAVAAMIDRYEYVKDSGAPGADSSERLLRSMVSLWWKVSQFDDGFDGIDPLRYVFARGMNLRESSRAQDSNLGAKWSMQVLVEFAETDRLWNVDNGGMLPIEWAATMGLKSTTAQLAKRMLESRPDLHKLPRSAIWSLSRCRHKTDFPDDLVHEIVIVDAMIRQREDEQRREEIAKRRHKEDAALRLANKTRAELTDIHSVAQRAQHSAKAARGNRMEGLSRQPQHPAVSSTWTAANERAAPLSSTWSAGQPSSARSMTSGTGVGRGSTGTRPSQLQVCTTARASQDARASVSGAGNPMSMATAHAAASDVSRPPTTGQQQQRPSAIAAGQSDASKLLPRLEGLPTEKEAKRSLPTDASAPRPVSRSLQPEEEPTPAETAPAHRGVVLSRHPHALPSDRRHDAARAGVRF